MHVQCVTGLPCRITFQEVGSHPGFRSLVVSICLQAKIDLGPISGAQRLEHEKERPESAGPFSSLQRSAQGRLSAKRSSLSCDTPAGGGVVQWSEAHVGPNEVPGPALTLTLLGSTLSPPISPLSIPPEPEPAFPIGRNRDPTLLPVRLFVFAFVPHR